MDFLYQKGLELTSVNSPRKSQTGSQGLCEDYYNNNTNFDRALLLGLIDELCLTDLKLSIRNGIVSDKRITFSAGCRHYIRFCRL